MRCEEKCCTIPVCLEFISVTATDEFKEQMQELFAEIFSDLCGSDDDSGHGNSDKVTTT